MQRQWDEGEGRLIEAHLDGTLNPGGDREKVHTTGSNKATRLVAVPLGRLDALDQLTCAAIAPRTDHKPSFLGVLLGQLDGVPCEHVRRTEARK